MTSSQARLPTVAVVLAGGTGARIGLDIPKQLLKIAGKTILEHTLDAFEFHPDIDGIIVVMASGHLTATERLIKGGGYRKVTRVLEGGADRVASTAKAITALSEAGPRGEDCKCVP
jgi:2-C-methyl-D-erythritol 4-phosphate cytidylyltransferase